MSEINFEDMFQLQRKNISILEKKYIKNLDLVAAGLQEYPNRNISASRKGVISQIWAPDGKIENESSIIHISSCPSWRSSARRTAFETSYSKSPDSLIANFASFLYEKSALLRASLLEYQGFWRVSLSSLESASYRGADWPNPAELWGKNYPYDLSFFDFLVPGSAQEFINQVLSSKIKIDEKSDTSLFQVYIGRTPLFRTGRLDEFETLRHMMELVIEKINDKRTDCSHPEPVICALCGTVTEPDHRVNAQFILPADFCPWCVLVIDHHDEIPLVYEGINQDSLRATMIDSFKRLVEISEFPYWKTPVLTRQLIVELSLRHRDKSQAIELSHLLACIPKRSTLRNIFETPQHFFHEAGLESLVPRGKGRGIRSISRCGHLCVSNGEREICEYLNSNQVPHSKEPVYAELVDGESEFGGMRGDFLANNIIIEFAGLDGDESYDAKMQTKALLSAKHGLNLVVVKPADLKRLPSVLPLSLFT